jgi:hypothetical protein
MIFMGVRFEWTLLMMISPSQPVEGMPRAQKEENEEEVAKGKIENEIKKDPT